MVLAPSVSGAEWRAGRLGVLAAAFALVADRVESGQGAAAEAGERSGEAGVESRQLTLSEKAIATAVEFLRSETSRRRLESK